MIARDPRAAAGDQVMVARQVVMDRNRQVFGYDLLYRAAGGADDEGDSRAGAARLLADAFTAIGLDALADGKRSFIPLGRATLLSGVPSLPTPERVVFVLDADATPDADLLDACRELRRQRFGVGIIAHADPDITQGLLTVADFLRVDIGAPGLDRAALSALLARAPHHVVSIATRVETQAQFTRAIQTGFDYFQGFFFGEPVIKEGRAIPAPQLARLKLVQALEDPNLSIDEVAALIKPDAALCYRTLRTVNSAGMAHGIEIRSIREALLQVGRDPIRRWAALWAFSEFSSHAASELLALSAIRGRFCELLAERRAPPVRTSEAFLLGLCSLLDAILNRPMSELVCELPLPADVRAALTGDPNPLRLLLDCATAYGSGEWDRATQLALTSGVDAKSLPKIYVEALRWARALQAPSATVA